MILLKLFWEFVKTGLFAVGGGMATVPFLYDISDKTGWFTHAELANFMAVAESTPGPIGVNMATYVGFTTAGIPGAVVATLGLVTPSIIVIVIIAAAVYAFISTGSGKGMLNKMKRSASEVTGGLLGKKDDDKTNRQ